MVRCSAPSCHRTSKGGLVKFCTFPRDPERRKIWTENCNREYWTPTFNSRLCRNHFEKSQFENHRADGRVKLKPNAIPTIFANPKPPKHQVDERGWLKRDNANTLPSQVTVELEIDSGREDHCYSKRRKIDDKNSDENGDDLSDEDSDNVQTEDDSCKHEQEDDVGTRHKPCEKCLLLHLEIQKLKRQLATMKKQMNNQTTNLEKIFSHDQIEALRHPSFKAASWSDKTIERCLQIRAATGHKGYEFLRSLSYPLPSFRTMTDRIKLTMSQQGQHLNNGPTLSHMRTNRKNLCAFAVKNLAISTNVHEVTLDI